MINNEKTQDIFILTILNTVEELIKYLSLNKVCEPAKHVIQTKNKQYEVIKNSGKYTLKVKNKIKLIDTTEINILQYIKNYEEKKSSINEYFYGHQNSLTNGLNHKLQSIKKYSGNVFIDLLGNGKIKVNDINFEIVNFAKIKQFISVNTSKLLLYIMHKLDLDTCIAVFNLSEYMEFKGTTRKDEENEDVINQFKILSAIGNIKYVSNVTFKNDQLFKINYHRRKGTIEISINFASTLKKQYAYYPLNIFKYKDNKYTLCFFIYEYARINKKCQFRLKIQSCLKRMNLPSYEEVKKGNRNFTDRIMTPFENYIHELMEDIKDLEIELSSNEANDFFDGYIDVKINNNEIIKCYRKIEVDEIKKRTKVNTENKKERKEKTLKLKKEGKTVKEISEILRLNKKTINNYLKETPKI